MKNYNEYQIDAIENYKNSMVGKNINDICFQYHYST